MNAYHSMQTSGVTWPVPVPPMLYRKIQEKSERLYQQRSGLPEEHEKQIGPPAPKESVLDDVRKHYLLPADASVPSYLTDHPAIIRILCEAAPRLKQFFGSATIFRLRAPVDESGVRTLYVVVVWPEEIGVVRSALARFDVEWWLVHSRQTSEYVVFTYELV